MLARIPPMVLIALLLAGCESGSNSNETPVQTGVQPADVVTTPVQQAQPVGPLLSESSSDFLPEGELDIKMSDNSVVITANAVDQQTILYRLATQAGFEITEAGVPWEVVTLSIKAESLHSALVELLKQHPYQIIYEYDPDRQADALARVVIGDLPTGQEGQQPPPAADAGMSAEIPVYHLLPDANEASLSAEERAYLAQLMDPSPEVREEAAARIEPAGIALDYLAQVVTTDPSPEVRMAAASTLEDSKDPRAVDALIMALQDEHPEVLVTVIEALTYTENRRTIPYLMPFLEHPDEDVRDAAENSLDQLN